MPARPVAPAMLAILEATALSASLDTTPTLGCAAYALSSVLIATNAQTGLTVVFAQLVIVDQRVAPASLGTSYLRLLPLPAVLAPKSAQTATNAAMAPSAQHALSDIQAQLAPYASSIMDLTVLFALLVPLGSHPWEEPLTASTAARRNLLTPAPTQLP